MLYENTRCNKNMEYNVFEYKYYKYIRNKKL